jgi:hypothetical protein
MCAPVSCGPLAHPLPIGAWRAAGTFPGWGLVPTAVVLQLQPLSAPPLPPVLDSGHNCAPAVSPPTGSFPTPAFVCAGEGSAAPPTRPEGGGDARPGHVFVPAEVKRERTAPYGPVFLAPTDARRRLLVRVVQADGRACILESCKEVAVHKVGTRGVVGGPTAQTCVSVNVAAGV